MTNLETKRGDTSPIQSYQLLDGDGNPPDLTDATVVQRFAGAPAAGAPCTIVGDPTAATVRLASRTHLPVPPSARSVTLPFETAVTFADTTVKTFPTAGYDRWTVWSDLDEVDA